VTPSTAGGGEPSDLERLQQLNDELDAQLSSDLLLKLIVELHFDGLLVVDRAGSIVHASSGVPDLFGYSESELLNQCVDILVPEGIRARHAQLREQYFERPRTITLRGRGEIYGRHKDGTPVPLRVGLTFNAANQTVYVAMVRQ